jgi:hypothetical protein
MASTRRAPAVGGGRTAVAGGEHDQRQPSAGVPQRTDQVGGGHRLGVPVLVLKLDGGGRAVRGQVQDVVVVGAAETVLDLGQRGDLEDPGLAGAAQLAHGVQDGLHLGLDVQLGRLRRGHSGEHLDRAGRRWRCRRGPVVDPPAHGHPAEQGQRQGLVGQSEQLDRQADGRVG